MSSLFRKEVFEAKRGDWLGTIRLSTPLSHSVLTLCSLAVGVALILFLIFGSYTRRERATGVLVPEAGLIEVTATSAGTVTDTVAEGALVHTGDPVVTLASERVSTALGDTARIVNEQLTQQRVRLDGDLQDQEKLTQEKATGIETQIVTLQAQLAQLDEQIAIQQRQNTSAHELLKKIAPLLAKGYVAAIQVQQQEVAALDAEAQGKTLARQRLDAQQQLATAQDQLRQLPLTSAAQKHDLEGKRAEIERALAENAVQRTTVWHAPKDGIVSSLFIKSGQAVNAGQILLAIVPKDSPLQAQLLVPSSAIGFIQPGDPVVLRYQAYPYQKFGLHQGRVKVVSRSAMTPAQVTNLLGQQARESLYRVDVELSAQKVEAYGTDEPLKPGMALEADILLDRRRLIEWVLEPLHSMGKKLSGN